MNLTSRELAILIALDQNGKMTVDGFVTRHAAYVNSWAPSFTGLRKKGLIERTGEKWPTTHGAMAFVVRITSAGRSALNDNMEVAA